MKYQDFQPADFIEDPYFRAWVANPNSNSDKFWKSFLSAHPEKFDEVWAAKNLLLAIHLKVSQDFSTKSNEDAVFSRIQTEIENDQPNSWRLPSWSRWLAAASVVMAIVFGLSKLPSSSSGDDYEVNRRELGVQLIEKVNNTAQTMVVKLRDGSIISIKPKSKISYASDFNKGSERKIYLSGEAFFNVTRNPKKPFLVYANDLVTKVLGTSFNVSAYQASNHVTVKVLTGKVSVVLSENYKTGQYPHAGTLLLPNQQATWLRDESKMVKNLVEDPIPLPDQTKNSVETFVYQSTPVKDVFRTLEKTYGVEIEFDEGLFANCLLTANLSDLSLYDKLDVICKSVEAKYDVIEAQIVVSGTGCDNDLNTN
ncbi:FecR family protein [Dyadobacter sp.]|uniref:FecR family protein n=1 Tax=Dyadobacter sp. TaxID=1914288 RepID=UPI003262E681